MRGRMALGLAALAVLSCRGGSTAAPRADAVTVSVPYDLDSLDPHARDLLGQGAIGADFYEALVGKDPELAIRPQLAIRWINPDPQTWVFTLRPGVRFHDGRPLSSADVVFSFERLRAHPELQVGVYAQDVEAIRALDALTVEIRTRRPSSVLLNKISGVLVVPNGATPETLAAQPDGTGPYRFVAWTPGERIEMVRNEGYWGVKPALKFVTLRLGRSDAAALADVLSGASDLAQCASRNAEQAVKARADIKLVRQKSVFLKYLGYDLARTATPYASTRGNPFKDRRVRQAIDLAIDRHALVERLPTFASPAGQLVPPTIFGFDPGLPEARFEPGRARALLAEAGFSHGFKVTLHVRALVGQAAEPVREMLGAIGIDATIELVPEQGFFQLIDSGPSLFLTRYGCDNGDASGILNACIHSRDPARHFGGANGGLYSNPALDRLIEASAEEPDHAERLQQLQDIMAKVMDDLVLVPLCFDDDVYLVRRPFTLRPRADSALLASEIGLERLP